MPTDKLAPLENTTDTFLQTASKVGQQHAVPPADPAQTVFQEVVRAETLIQLKGKVDSMSRYNLALPLRENAKHVGDSMLLCRTQCAFFLAWTNGYSAKSFSVLIVPGQSRQPQIVLAPNCAVFGAHLCSRHSNQAFQKTWRTSFAMRQHNSTGCAYCCLQWNSSSTCSTPWRCPRRTGCALYKESLSKFGFI